ncbi:hypothetical protein [Natronoglycomyces albus]|uniref:DUF4386 family protein n=1 Tax=Natronoglycomyces albus TaxID=2811108 RepID=A0A895XPC3_9ACTN|nr:hypothetical protein [Natronoglycomyces albus]QSB04140.1 hypothetical protein JQS30_09975 [Natronoglycomyces albus]
MGTHPSTRSLLGATSFALAGIAFILYPTLRPWGDKTEGDTVANAAAFASDAWLVSHCLGMVGFIATAVGLWTFAGWINAGPHTRLLTAAAATFLTGVGLTLPYYGLETFTLNTVAKELSAGEAVALADQIREHSLAMTFFGLGLVALALGAVMAAVALWRTGIAHRWSAVIMAGGFALYLPQFFTPPAARIGHGLVLGLGLLWMAWAMLRPAKAVGSQAGEG